MCPTNTLQFKNILKISEDFPGGPVVKTLHFHCRGRGFDPWSGKFRMPGGVAKKNKKNNEDMKKGCNMTEA